MSVLDEIKLFLSNAWSFIKPFIMNMAKHQMELMIPVAIGIVKEIANDPNMNKPGVTWQDKLTKGVDGLKEVALTKGVQIATSDAIDLVQTALRNVRTNETPQASK